MSDCVTLPPQPVKARYATRSEPTAREGSAAQYAGGPSTIVAGPKYGAAGAPPAGGARGALKAPPGNRANAPRNTRRGARPRTVGDPTMPAWSLVGRGRRRSILFAAG